METTCLNKVMKCSACGRELPFDHNEGSWMTGKTTSDGEGRYAILAMCDGCERYVKGRPLGEREFVASLVGMARVTGLATLIMDYFLTHHASRVEGAGRLEMLHRRVTLFLASGALKGVRSAPPLTVVLQNAQRAVPDATEQEVLDCLVKLGVSVAFDPGTLH